MPLCDCCQRYSGYRANRRRRRVVAYRECTLVGLPQMYLSLRQVVWATSTYFRLADGDPVAVVDGEFNSFGRFTTPAKAQLRSAQVL